MSLPVIQPEIRNFDRFTSEVICLPLKDIDTDMIMPAEFLKVTSREGLGKHIFDVVKREDPNFPEFKGQRILVTGQNFGCGSSREHAPWGLKDAGIDVIIASDFADIFKGNAEKNGILPVVLAEEVVQLFISQANTPSEGENFALSIDLENQLVIDPNGTEYQFEISSFAKKRLLEDLSDLDYLMQFQEQIQEFDGKQRAIGL